MYKQAGFFFKNNLIIFLCAFSLLAFPHHGQAQVYVPIKPGGIRVMLVLSPVPAAAATGGRHPPPVMRLPLDKLRVTSPFGVRRHPLSGLYRFHRGIDLAAHGDRVLSVLAGSVSAAGYEPALGNFVQLRCGRWQLLYGHLSRCFVRKGQHLKAGEILGLTGATGQCTGEHLHFAVYLDGKPIDPLRFLSLNSLII